MADGTTDAPAPGSSIHKIRWPVRGDMVPIQLTHQYDSYVFEGAQYNSGERLSVPMAEAERLILDGAAVRQSEEAATETSEKALAHPPQHKMVQPAVTK